MTLAEDTGHSRGSGRGLGSDLKDNSEHLNLMSMGENITRILQMVVGVRVHSFIHPLIHSFIHSFLVAMFQCLLCQSLRELGHNKMIMPSWDQRGYRP